MRHMLTQALGHDVTDVPVGQEALEPGDVFLMCTDGLYGPVGESAILEVLGNGAEAAAQAERPRPAAAEAEGPLGASGGDHGHADLLL